MSRNEGRLRDEAERNPDFAALLREARGVADLGAQMTALRLARGWSRQELAQRSGLDATLIEDVERGLQTPTLAVLWRLTDALNAVVMLGPGASTAALDRQHLTPALPVTAERGERSAPSTAGVGYVAGAALGYTGRRRTLKPVGPATRENRPAR